MRRIPIALAALAVAAQAARAADAPPPEAVDVAKVLGLARVGNVHIDAGALRVADGKTVAVNVTGKVMGDDGKLSPARFGSVTITGARPEGEGEGRAYDLVEVVDADLGGRRIGRVTAVGVHWSRTDLRFDGAQAERVARDDGPAILADAIRLTPLAWGDKVPSRFTLQARGFRNGMFDEPLAGVPGYAGTIDFDVTGGYDPAKGAFAPEAGSAWIGKLATVDLAASGLSYTTGSPPAPGMAIAPASVTAITPRGLSLAKSGTIKVTLTDSGLANAVRMWVQRTTAMPPHLAPIILAAYAERKLPDTLNAAFKAKLGSAIRQFMLSPGTFEARFAGSFEASGGKFGSGPVLATGAGSDLVGTVEANRPPAP